MSIEASSPAITPSQISLENFSFSLPSTPTLTPRGRPKKLKRAFQPLGEESRDTTISKKRKGIWEDGIQNECIQIKPDLLTEIIKEALEPLKIEILSLKSEIRELIRLSKEEKKETEKIAPKKAIIPQKTTPLRERPTGEENTQTAP